jgi:hypothetical protein
VTHDLNQGITLIIYLSNRDSSPEPDWDITSDHTDSEVGVNILDYVGLNDIPGAIDVPDEVVQDSDSDGLPELVAGSPFDDEVKDQNSDNDEMLELVAGSPLEEEVKDNDELPELAAGSPFEEEAKNQDSNDNNCRSWWLVVLLERKQRAHVLTTTSYRS